jgi:hypothetical protein
MQQMPAVFNEGFMFSPFNGDNTIDFSPVLLSYQKDKANAPLKLQAKFMKGGTVPVVSSSDKLILPAKSADFGWIFSIQKLCLL